jgi:hypothetical protein
MFGIAPFYYINLQHNQDVSRLHLNSLIIKFLNL